MTTSEKSRLMKAQYAAWPYPQVPLLAKLPSTHPWELHVSWLWDRCGSGAAPAAPRIWIAGCGTFQPYALAVANPKAEIVATDLSEPSLALAKRRCSWHRQKHVTFAPVDLADESTWPEGEFDLIECYGVLMNLPDPGATLRGLRQRLTKRGVLRVMVYPHYSRQRVFQVQRLAKLLGLTANERHHPNVLRQFIKKLERNHPLRYAFTTYEDSKNDAGIVDGFLHQGDRGFTAFELGDLLQGAGLAPAFWFHRPWAQPDKMATRLEMAAASQSFVLNYLDLWQELRTNFVVCARRSDAPATLTQEPSAHPMFAGKSGGLRHRLRLERLRWLGGSVPTRTETGSIALKASEARGLRSAGSQDQGSPLVIGGRDHSVKLAPHSEFANEPTWLKNNRALRVGARSPNPLYAHIFAAFELAKQHPELDLPDLERQMGRWLPWADPLEEGSISFGLTPYATLKKMRVNITEHLERAPLPTAERYGDVRVRGDDQALQRVRRMLAEHGDLPQSTYDDATLRELFVLLCTQDRLFVTFE